MKAINYSNPALGNLTDYSSVDYYKENDRDNVKDKNNYRDNYDDKDSYKDNAKKKEME